MPLIFQAKLPPDVTYWHHAHFWRNQLRENALSSAPLNQTFNSDKWLPGSRRSRGVLVSKMLRSPSANKLPLGTPLIFTGSIRRALARSLSLLLHCQQLEELLVSDRQLATQGYLSLGANSPAQFQHCTAAGAGESGKQLH